MSNGEGLGTDALLILFALGVILVCLFLLPTDAR